MLFLLLANIPSSVTISVVCTGQASSAPSLTTAELVRLSLKRFMFCFSSFSRHKFWQTLSRLLEVEMPRSDIDLSTVSIASISTRSYLLSLEEMGNVEKYGQTVRHPNQRSRCWKFQDFQHPGSSVSRPEKIFEYTLVLCKNIGLSK